MLLQLSAAGNALTNSQHLTRTSMSLNIGSLKSARGYGRVRTVDRKMMNTAHGRTMTDLLLATIFKGIMKQQ